jgi:GNAT superfamily N-acetyltransferase
MVLYIAEDQQTDQGIKDLLYEDGVIRGWCKKRINGQVLWIGMIQTDPPRQGYGSAFMEIYEEYGRDFGCQMVECEPQGSAIGFWNNIGFINTGPRMMHYPPRLSDDIYQKII